MSIILIVDDLKDNLISLEVTLKQLPDKFEILKAMNGADALKITGDRLPDVILLDINMPEMDGYQVCSAIRKNINLPYIPIIFLTAHDVDIDSKIKGYDTGADDFIAKPVNNNELFARLRSVLRIKKLHDDLQRERDLLEVTVDERTRELQIMNEELKNMNAALTAVQDDMTNLLVQKETLLAEIHHRVKNNMQVIVSLLQLQSRSISDENVRIPLKECENRIRSMALVHEKLYKSLDFSKINFDEYVTGLIDILYTSYGKSSSEIIIISKIKNIELNVEKAVPCGLIITELVTNIFKHAFPDSRKGEVMIDFHRDPEEKYSLNIKDNGVGFSDVIDAANTSSLGLNLVCALTKQLNGTIQFNSGEGAAVGIVFNS